jgi:hypothetical protein
MEEESHGERNIAWGRRASAIGLRPDLGLSLRASGFGKAFRLLVF